MNHTEPAVDLKSSLPLLHICFAQQIKICPCIRDHSAQPNTNICLSWDSVFYKFPSLEDRTDYHVTIQLTYILKASHCHLLAHISNYYNNKLQPKMMSSKQNYLHQKKLQDKNSGVVPINLRPCVWTLLTYWIEDIWHCMLYWPWRVWGRHLQAVPVPQRALSWVFLNLCPDLLKIPVKICQRKCIIINHNRKRVYVK